MHVSKKARVWENVRSTRSSPASQESHMGLWVHARHSDALFKELLKRIHKRHWSSGCQPIILRSSLLPQRKPWSLIYWRRPHTNLTPRSPRLVHSEPCPQRSRPKVLAMSTYLIDSRVQDLMSELQFCETRAGKEVPDASCHKMDCPRKKGRAVKRDEQGNRLSAFGHCAFSFQRAMMQGGIDYPLQNPHHICS